MPLRISYVRCGPISFESTFGYEHTRLGLGMAMVELGHEFTFFNVSSGREDLKQHGIRSLNGFTAQKKHLKKTDILIVEQAERALPRFWTNPKNADPKGGAQVTEDNIHATEMYRLWATLREYEGPVALVYNDPKCRAQLLPESIALRYLRHPIAHWITRNKKLVVITEANNTKALMEEDAAWKDNTDMSARGYGLKAYSANLSTGCFTLGFSTQAESNPHVLAKIDPKEWMNRPYDFIYYGKPKNQRPRELVKHFWDRRGLIVGNGWDKLLNEKYPGWEKNWDIRPSMSREDLNTAIRSARYSACIGDDHYFRFKSFTGRPFESIMLGSIPLISPEFFDEPTTKDRWYREGQHGFNCPEEFRIKGWNDIGQTVLRKGLLKPIDTLMSNMKYAASVAERIVHIMSNTNETGHTGSLTAAYQHYLNYRLRPDRLKTYPMDEEHQTRARKHGDYYASL